MGVWLERHTHTHTVKVAEQNKCEVTGLLRNSRSPIEKHAVCVCVQRDCVHPAVEIYCSLLVYGRQEQTAHLPSDGRRRRAEDRAVHHHSLPLHRRVVLPILGQNHGGQICERQNLIINLRLLEKQRMP